MPISHDIGTLDIAHLLRCLLMLSLHYVASDDAIMSRKTQLRKLVEFTFLLLKQRFKG